MPKEYKKILEEQQAEKVAAAIKSAAEENSPDVIEGVDLYQEDIMQDTPAHTLEPVSCILCKIYFLKRVIIYNSYL